MRVRLPSLSRNPWVPAEAAAFRIERRETWGCVAARTARLLPCRPYTVPFPGRVFFANGLLPRRRCGSQYIRKTFQLQEQSMARRGGGAQPSSLAMTLVSAPVFSPRGGGGIRSPRYIPTGERGSLAISVWSVVLCFSTRGNKIEGGVAAVAFPFWWAWSANPCRLLRGLHKQEKCCTSGWVSVIRFLRCQQRQKISFFVSHDSWISLFCQHWLQLLQLYTSVFRNCWDNPLEREMQHIYSG